MSGPLYVCASDKISVRTRPVKGGTPLATAWALTKVWPDADLHIVPDAGHSSLDSSIVDQLIRATRSFGKLFG